MTTAIVDDHANNATDASAIGADGKASGTLEVAGDADWFQISLSPGHTYSIALNGSPSGDGTLSDPTVYLYDNSGHQLAVDDDSGAGANSLITYTPPGSLGDPAATYYIVARAYHDAGAGTYQLAVTGTENADDYGNNIHTLGTIADGHAVSGSLEVASDVDWFKVMLTAGTKYSISLAGSPSASGTLSDPFVTLYDGTGQVLASDDDSGTGAESLLTFTAPGTAGTETAYYIAAGSYHGHVSGTYELNVASAPVVADDYASSVNVDDFPNSAATATPIVVGQTVNGIVNTAGDSDWFQVNLTAGTSYVIAMNGAEGSLGARTLGDPGVALYNAIGQQVAFNDDGSGANSRLVYTPSTTGAFLIQAAAASSIELAARGTGTYQLEVNTGTVTLPTQLPKLIAGGEASGDLEAPVTGPQYRVPLNAHTTYTFSGGRASGNLDPHLTLTDSHGQVVASDSAAAGNSSATMVFTPSDTDTYYLTTSPYTSGNTGNYTVFMSCAAASSGGGTLPSVGAIDLGQPVNGTVTGTAHGTLEVAGDADWFAVTLTAGTAYSIGLKGSPSGAGTLADPYVYLYDHTGQALVFDDDSGTGSDSLLTYTPSSTDTYYVGARSYHDQGTGTYQIAVTGAGGGGGGGGDGADDHADNLTDTTAPMGSINPGSQVSATGSLESVGDRDWFQISMAAGSTYAIGLNGSPNGAGTLADPFVYLYDSAGNQIATNDDDGTGANSLITYTPVTTGTYYVGAASYHDLGAGTYQIQATKTTAQTDDWGQDKDHHGTIAALGTIVGSEQSVTGKLESIQDADWYAVTLDADTVYSFALNGIASGQGALSDPYVYLYDTQGENVLESNDDGGPGSNSLLAFTPTATGTYFIAARAFHDQGTGAYELDVTLTGLPPVASP